MDIAKTVVANEKFECELRRLGYLIKCATFHLNATMAGGAGP